MIRPHNRQSYIDYRSARLPSEPPDNDYDPRQHRTPEVPIKLWMAYLNLLRTAFGPGMLGLPLAISQTGIVVGPILALSTGLLIIHTHGMLDGFVGTFAPPHTLPPNSSVQLWCLTGMELNCLNEVSRQLGVPYISYRYGFRMALFHGPPCFTCIARNGPAIVATFMFLSQIGICTVFVTFTSDSLRDVMDLTSNRDALLILLLPYLLLEFFMKNLRIVSYVSMLGNLLNIAGLTVTLYHVFLEPHGVVVNATLQPIPLLFAFGTFLFNLTVLGVVLSIDKSLKDPTLLTKPFGVLHIGMIVPTIIGTTFGALGYWSFGTMEENVLRSLPFDDVSAMVAIALYMVTIAFAFPIQCYPGIQILVDVIKNHNVEYEPSPKMLKVIERIIRPSFVLLSFLISYLIPFQGPFVAFVGNICTAMLALVFPAMMEISLMYPGPFGRGNIYLIKDILIIILGIVCFVFGGILTGYLIYVRILSNRLTDIDIDL